MNDNPLFSVLIAQYNNARYLMEAIESVRNQTYSNWEIVMVDDASTDNSSELYKQLADDSHIRIFFNEKNEGVGYTKHRCAELANGELCGYLDPDDALVPTALEQHVKTHNEHEDVSVVYSWCYYCDEQMRVKDTHYLPQIEPGRDFLTQGLWGQTTAFTSFKMSYYHKTDGICLYRAGEDQDLNFKLEEVGRSMVLEEVTYLCRMREQSLSRGDGEVECLYWNIKVVEKACKRRGIDEKRLLMGVLRQSKDWDIRKGFRLAQASYRYRLGNLLMWPVDVIKKLLRR